MRTKLLCIALSLTLTACHAEKKGEQPSDERNDSTEAVAPVQIEEGSLAPDFTLLSADGTMLTLSSLRGRYVVLDFWGTWCKWCVKGIPDMKKYYEKYNGMFEILSIDVGDSEDTWQKAIKTYGMEWLHVYATNEEAKQLTLAYAVQGFPTKIVVDPEGKIAHITIGEAPEFYRYLDDQFGGK